MCFRKKSGPINHVWLKVEQFSVIATLRSYAPLSAASAATREFNEAMLSAPYSQAFSTHSSRRGRRAGRADALLVKSKMLNLFVVASL